jgi:phage portal protein BeeE
MTPLAKFARRTKGLTLTMAGDPQREGSSWFYPTSTSQMGDKEDIGSSFESYVQDAYKRNGIVFACVLARQLPFSEARFQYQELLEGRPGRLFDGPALSLLANPWPNGTTGELLSRMEQDASLAGNFYATTVGNGANAYLRRLRPDWVTIVSGVRGDRSKSAFSLDAEVLGYIYTPNGKAADAVLLSTDRVVHYSPIPDPEAQWRGMSWLTPIVREITADSYATRHKLKFFENGAALNVVVTYDKGINPDNFKRFVEIFDDRHRGTSNAYETLHLGGGADATVVGTDLKSIDFKSVQGAGESRIAAAAGVGAIIARFSEGLAGSSLNQGNYGAAKRQFADMTLRPLWRSAAASLAKFVSPPQNSRLWIDTRDVEFLKEDRKDAAEILSTSAQTIKALVDAGYEPDAVVDAVEAGDLSRLTGKHSGLYSVQLQAPGGGEEELPLNVQVEAAGALVRAGYDPAAALTAVGMDPIRHLGLLPVTLQSAKQLELTPAQAPPTDLPPEGGTP